jgi:hypothetical protein
MSKHAKKLYCNIQVILVFDWNKMHIYYVKKIVTVKAEFSNSFLVLSIREGKFVYVHVTKRHVWGNGGRASFILILSIRWR